MIEFVLVARFDDKKKFVASNEKIRVQGLLIKEFNVDSEVHFVKWNVFVTLIKVHEHGMPFKELLPLLRETCVDLLGTDKITLVAV